MLLELVQVIMPIVSLRIPAIRTIPRLRTNKTPKGEADRKASREAVHLYKLAADED
jgi:hypothetical protein